MLQELERNRKNEGINHHGLFPHLSHIHLIVTAILRCDGSPITLAAVLVELRQLEALELPAAIKVVEVSIPEAPVAVVRLPCDCVPLGFHGQKGNSTSSSHSCAIKAKETGASEKK